MNMDEKIRRAFRGATPNILGYLPNRGTPQGKKRRRLSARAQEFIATATSVALLIGAVGVGVIYFRNHYPAGVEPTGSTATGSTATGSTAPVPPPVCIDTEAMIAQDRDTVCPSPTEEMDVELYMEDGTNGIWYTVKIHYRGYTYLFSHDDGGVLHEIEVPLCDCRKEGYITETVAQQIASLYVSQRNPCVIDDAKLIQPQDGSDAYYRIGLSGKILSWSEDYYVNAATGELELWRRPPGNPVCQPVPEEELIAAARAVVDPYVTGGTLSAKTEWYVLPVYNFTWYYCLVTVRYQGYLYHLEYDGDTGDLESITVVPPEDSGEHRITESVAAEVARLEVCSGHYHSHSDTGAPAWATAVTLDEENGIYEVTVTCDGTHVCHVNSLTGELLDSLEK